MSINPTQETIAAGDPPVKPGIYLAQVVGHLDKNYMGALEVRLQRPVGNDVASGQVYPAKYMSPFYGVTAQSTTSQNDDFANTQKSYGMWMVPPDVGTTVIVLFIQGDSRYGYWIGCVPSDDMNFMLPGIAATKFTVDGEGRVPVGEYNRTVNSGAQPDPTKIKKPQHPLVELMTEQGLIKDDVRGITTSSARREVPSSVFGISTPGPLDKAGPQGKQGFRNNTVMIPTNRLGGTTFVMDDGDDKFLRKTPASEGPPEYARTENSDTDGDAKIPHNELVRIRTRTGHQILLHNSEDLIYIGNSKGTTWVELTSNGKIDIFAEDSISIHTKNDINFKADRDVNIEAGRNFNVSASQNVHIEATANVETLAGVDTKITSLANSNINSGIEHRETAGKIYMNSASKAEITEALKRFALTDEEGAALESIMLRVPTHEPWPHHENLDPLSYSAEKTDIEAGTPPAVPKAWTQYSTENDTFEKISPPNQNTGT